jgi:membrane protein DedA with SNARE-associated domain
LETFSEYGYVGMFVAIIITGLGFPMPEELPVFTAGVLVGHADTLQPGQTELPPDRLRWYIMIPVLIGAIIVGDGFLYGIGRLWGPRLLSSSYVQRKILTPEKRAKIEQNYRDRGVLILLTARLTPGIRTPIFIMAGVLRVPLGRFLLADGLYAIPGVNVMFWLSYFLGNQVLEAFHRAEQYRALIAFGLLSAVVGIVLYRIAVNRRVATGTQAEVPIYNKPVEKVTEAAEHAVEAAIKKTIDVVSNLSHGDKPPEATAVPPKADPPVPG